MNDVHTEKTDRPGPVDQSGPAGYAAPSASLSPDAERNWAVATHLSSFVGAYVALGLVGPLVVMLTVGKQSALVRRHAVEALNFNLSWLMWLCVAGLLSVVLIGIPLLVALGIAYLVVVVLAAVEASNGREYRYPLTLRLVS